MSEIPKFSIEDLRTRYDLEPTLNDLYVEGSFDKEIIERAISSTNQPFRAIYEINAVDVPPKLVESHHLTDGNKQRVITLARELAKLKNQCHYKCLVDRDLDHWFGPLEKTKRLAWTEHTSIELYYLSESFIRDIILITARCDISDWEKYFSSFIATLKFQYAMRLADRSLGYSLKWVSADKSLGSRGGEIIFNHQDYIKKTLISNGKGHDISAYQIEVSRWCDLLLTDPRSYIRGHDMVSLISWTVKSFKGQREYASSSAIERLFVLLSDRASKILETIG
jgi:hypothetical protein